MTGNAAMFAATTTRKNVYKLAAKLATKCLN